MPSRETEAGPGAAPASEAVPLPLEPDVRLAQAGDRAAFDRLAASHREAMYRAAYHVLRNVEDALDATQEALLKAYRHLETFDRRTTFGAWTYRIATNAALDRLARRRRDRERSSGLPEDDALADRSEAEAGEDLERAEAREAVRRAIEALPPAQRAAVLLRDVEGLSYAEISERLGIARGTVMSRIYYGRENLKETLKRTLKAREAVP